MNLALNVGEVETLIYNISYDLGLVDKDNDYASKEISTFNKKIQNLFEVYLAKYGSTPFMTSCKIYGLLHWLLMIIVRGEHGAVLGPNRKPKDAVFEF